MEASSLSEQKGRGRQGTALRTRRTPPFRRWISEIRADAHKCYSAVSMATSGEAKAQAFKEHFRNLGERLSFYQWQLFRHVTPSVARDVLPEDQRQLLRSELKAIWDRRVSPKLLSWISKASADAKPEGWCAPEWLRRTMYHPSDIDALDHRLWRRENLDHSPSSHEGFMSVLETDEVLSRLKFELEYRLLLDSDRIIREFILSAESPASLKVRKQRRKWPIVLRREQNRRDQIICEIIKSGLKGLDYCKEMDAQGVRPPKARNEAANSLPTYVQTYYAKRWRDRIWQEKKTLTRKYRLKG